jgi:TRAP-type uncharacterized transport system substrate-binding protein
MKPSRFVAALATTLTVALAAPVHAQTEVPWGTSAVGSSGHKALVALEGLLNKQWTGYNVTTQPTPGAIVSVKGFTTGQFKGMYGSDVAFYELANDTARFKGFSAQIKNEPVQSMWVFTVEVGLGIHSRDRDTIKKWSDLSGKRVFTGPLPWDTRAQIERAMAAVGVKHEYQEVDLSSVGSLLDQGSIKGFLTYTNAEAATAPWISEAGLASDWAALNPAPDELATLREKGFDIVQVKPGNIFGKDVHADSLTLIPFFYGFHLGLDVPADDVYRLLDIVDKNAAELAKGDKGFSQIANDMKGMQRRGVASSIEYVRVHPGLARWMRDRGVWDAKWDARVAKQ